MTTPSSADERALPLLPRPACTFADHSYPAFTADQMRAYVRDDRASLGAAQVPAGWKLVPVEPTDEMIAAADSADSEYQKRTGLNIPQGGYDHYCAMLRAAPESPAGAAQVPAGWVLLPAKITDAMIEAAVIAHYGARAVGAVGGAGGVSMTVNGEDFTAKQALKRMWKGLLAAAPEAPAGAAQVPASDEHVAEVYTMEALVPGGGVKHHVSLRAPLPAGPKLYTRPSAGAAQVPSLSDAQIMAIWNHCDQPSKENDYTTGPVPFARALIAALSQPSQPATAAKDTAP